MADIFQACHFDDDGPAVHYVFYSQFEGYYYAGPSFETDVEARRYMAQQTDGAPMLIQRVTYEVISRSDREELTAAP